MAATTTAYASDLLGRPVHDPSGETVGKVTDLLVPADTDFPTVDAIVVKPQRGDPRAVGWLSIDVVSDLYLGLAVPLEQTAPYEGQHELSLAHQVLDRQIIDVNGVRVVRVNDLQLAPSSGTFRVVGIDVSTAGLLHRLGIDKPLAAVGIRPTPRTIAWQDIEPVESGAAGVRVRVSHDDLARLRPADVAHVISQLDHKHGGEVLESLDDEAAAYALGELHEDLQVTLIRGMDAERAADILEEMEPDEAADLLGDLEPEHAQDLLNRMEPDDADDVRELLSYGDDCAGGLMTTDVVAVPASLTAGQVIDVVRTEAVEMGSVYYVYVEDEQGHLEGALSLRELIVANPNAPIREAMHHDLVIAHLEDSAEDVARLIARYNLLALPVLDNSGHLKGIVTVDDAMDVILPEQWQARLPRVFRRA